jgi:hypothetical protein
VPAAAHTAGVGDSLWRTDLTVANLGAQSAVVTVALVTSDGGEPVATFSERLAAGTSRAYGDVVRNHLARSGTGALRLTIDRGQMVASSRTYNQSSTGTYGQFIAAVGERAVVAGGATALLLQLRADAAFRSNLGVVNLGGQPLEVGARFFTLDGALIGSRLYSVRPHAHLQVNGAVPGGEVAGAFALLASDDADARFLAYASVVDNGSDDPVYVPAVVLAD